MPTTIMPDNNNRPDSCDIRPSYVAVICLDEQHTVMDANQLARQWFLLADKTGLQLTDDWLQSQGIQLNDRRFRALSILHLLEKKHNDAFVGLKLAGQTRWVRWELKQDNNKLILFLSDVTELMTELYDLEQKAEDASMRDLSTGLYNRAYAMDRLTQMHKYSKRYQTTYTMALVDIDYIKRINDTFGHSFGDEVIRRVADVIRRGFRETDLCARIGGEEFLILMPETLSSEAIYSIDRLRQQISELKWDKMQRPVTVSSGVVSWQENKSVEQLIFIADQRLRTAKRAGRNQVCGDLS